MSDVTASANPLRAYAAVTAAYWAFMLSDGALRMLVLLHFNALGFSPVQLALFLLYEVAGIVTNLAAGWLAARFGLAATLYGGLSLQIGALVALAQLTRPGRLRPRSPSSWRCRASRAWPRIWPRCRRNLR